MKHEVAKRIFEEIRNRPYAWSTQLGVPANNCYFKGIELLQRLGILGYAVRGRVGNTYLDQKVPEEIRMLYPKDPKYGLTHFWIEAEIDGYWRVLDPSYDPALGRVGFRFNEWGSGETCFDITEEYSPERTIEYQELWNQPDYGVAYFDAVSECAIAMNRWLESIRDSSAGIR